MKIKPGANIQGLHPNMSAALKIADSWWENFGDELVITSGLDGEHSAGSKHYSGRAVDCRTRNFTKEYTEKLAHRLSVELGCLFVVLNEANHIHIHYNGY